MTKHSNHTYTSFEDFVKELEGMKDEVGDVFKEINVDIWRRRNGSVEMKVDMLVKTVEEIVEGNGVL